MPEVVFQVFAPAKSLPGFETVQIVAVDPAASLRKAVSVQIERHPGAVRASTPDLELCAVGRSLGEALETLSRALARNGSPRSQTATQV